MDFIEDDYLVNVDASLFFDFISLSHDYEMENDNNINDLT